MTKRFFTYALFVFIAYAFYSYTANPLLLGVVLFMIAIALVSLLALILGSWGLRVRGHVSPKTLKRFEPFTLHLHLENRSLIYLSAIRLSIGLPLAKGEVLALPTDADDNPDYDELQNMVLSGRRDLDDEVEARRTLLNFWGQRVPAEDDKNRSAPPRLSDQESKEEEQRLRSRVFYRPGKNYSLNRKTLWYPRPHLVDEQKLRYFSLAPGQTLKQDFQFVANHKGVLDFGVDHLMIKDWFGFFCFPRRIKVSEKGSGSGDDHAAFPLLVQPSARIWSQAISPHLADPRQVLMAPQSVRVSPEIDTLANIRSYQPGDKMKSIHWNISARTGEWMVREFEDPRQGGLLFIMEPRWPDKGRVATGWEDSYVDQVTEITASLLDFLSRTEGPLTLVSSSRNIEAAGEGQAPNILYEELAVWRPSRDGFALPMLIRQVNQQRSFRGVIVVTSTVTASLEAELLRLQRRGTQVVLAVLHSEETSREELEERTKLVRLAKVYVIFFPSQALRIPPATDLAGTSANPDNEPASPLTGTETTTDEVPT